MKWLRQILLLATAVVLVVFLGHILPTLLQAPHGPALPQTSIYDTVPQMDTVIPLPEILQKELQVIHTSKPRKGKPPTWTLGKGIPLPVYMLRAQRCILANGGAIVRMVEGNGRKGAHLLQWKEKSGDTASVQLVIGETWLDSASMLAVAFAADSLGLEVLASLERLGIPYTLLLRPDDSVQGIAHDLDKLTGEEVVLWQPMEPVNYPYVNPGKSAIYIHNTPDQIRSILSKNLQRFPGTVGVATFLGSRAVENPGLLDALLRELGTRNLFFLDLTESRLSRTDETCRRLGIDCRRHSQPAKDPDQELQSALSDARTTGQGIALLELNLKSIAAVQKSFAAAKEQGTNFAKISDIIGNPDGSARTD